MAISSLVAAGTAPSSDRDVWAPAMGSLANWKNPITVRTGFETRIQQALTLSEQRRILRGSPRRSLSCTLTGTGRSDTLTLRQLLTRASIAGFLMPLYPDQIELKAAAAAGATTLTGDFAYRRLFVGNRAMLFSPLWGDGSFDVVQIDSLTGPDQIGLAAAISRKYEAGALLIPLFESRLVDSFSNGFVITDDKADFQNFTAQEIVGPTQIDGIEAVGTNPSGFDTFNSSTAGTLPVFAGPVDYSNIKFSLNRIGSTSNVGLEEMPVFYGERGLQRINALIQCLSRKEAWDTIRFFESRGGRAYPFWLRSPWEDYKVTGTNGNNLLVEATGDLLDWNYRPYLVMQLSDGSFDYREIESVVENGTSHEISFVGGAALGSVVDARQLFLMRMFRDEIAERWRTTEQCQLTLEAVELLQEKVITMTETLATHTGDSIVTDTGDLIGLGIFLSDDVTAPLSPDIAMGGCEAIVKLTPCDTGTAIFTNNGLTDFSAVAADDWLDLDGKAVEVSGAWYEVSIVTGSQALSSVVVSDSADACPVAPCTGCDPTGAGSAPKPMAVSGASNNTNCDDANDTVAYLSFNEETDYCEWLWNDGGGQSGSVVSPVLRYYKNPATWNYSGCSLVMSQGEWAIAIETRDSLDAGYFYQEKTIGFACGSGRVSGTHSFTNTCADDGATNCSDTLTVTVDP